MVAIIAFVLSVGIGSPFPANPGISTELLLAQAFTISDDDDLAPARQKMPKKGKKRKKAKTNKRLTEDDLWGDDSADTEVKPTPKKKKKPQEEPADEGDVDPERPEYQGGYGKIDKGWGSDADWGSEADSQRTTGKKKRKKVYSDDEEFPDTAVYSDEQEADNAQKKRPVVAEENKGAQEELPKTDKPKTEPLSAMSSEVDLAALQAKIFLHREPCPI